MRNPGSLLLSSLHSSLSNLGGRERKEGWRKVAKRRGRRGWELEGGYHCYIIAHGRTQKRTAPPQQRELAAAPRTRPGARIEGETSRSGPEAAPSASEAPTEPLQSHRAEEEAVPRPCSSKGGRKEAPGPESSTAGCSPA